MSSVDGRLIDSRWSAPYKAEHGELLKVYASIGHELNTDAWMFGKNTPRAVFPGRFGVAGPAVTSDTPAVFIGRRCSERIIFGSIHHFFIGEPWLPDLPDFSVISSGPPSFNHSCDF